MTGMSRDEKMDYFVRKNFYAKWPQLQLCAYKGDLEKCKELLGKEDADVNQRDIHQNTALFFAKEPEVIRLLLEKGADVNAKDVKGSTPLHDAVVFSGKEKVKLLLDAGASVHDKEIWYGRTPLHEAAGSDFPDVQIVELLLQHGANINQKTAFKWTPLHIAAAAHNTTIVRRLLEMGACVNSKGPVGGNPLHNALYSEDAFIPKKDTIEVLLEYGADVNDASTLDEKTPLNRAAGKLSKSSLGMIRLLLAQPQGTNVNACNKFGQSPLMACASAWAPGDVTEDHENDDNFEDVDFVLAYQQLQILTELLDRGAEINAQDMNGYTALYHALIGVCNQKVALFLLSKGADVTMKDRFGASAVHFATHYIMGDFLKQLLDSEPDLIRERDMFGSTPLHWAAWHGDDDIINILLQRGANKEDIDLDGNTPYDVASLEAYKTTLDLLVCDNDNDAEPVKIVGIETSCECCDNAAYLLPSDTSPEQCTSPADVLKLIESIPNTDEFLLSALHKPGLGMIPKWKESDHILQAVTTLVQAVVEKVGQLDERFTISLVPSGSSQEGTKCCTPNEFDFMCCFDKFSQQCDSDMSASPAGFTRIWRKQELVPSKEGDQFAEFFEETGSINVNRLHRTFINLVQEALWNKDIWLLPGLQFVAEEFFEETGPSCALEVQWRGQKFKDLNISVDLVPALKVNHWPINAIRSTSLVKEPLESHGCHAVMKAPVAGMYNVAESPDSRDFMRISFSKLETSILQNMPQFSRDALTLMKTIRSLCTAAVHSITERFLDVNDLITTYMLKTLMFRVLDKSGTGQCPGESGNATTLRIARNVFRELEQALEEQNLPSFFVPSLNLLQAPSVLQESETLAEVERAGLAQTKQDRWYTENDLPMMKTRGKILGNKGVTILKNIEDYEGPLSAPMEDAPVSMEDASVSIEDASATLEDASASLEDATTSDGSASMEDASASMEAVSASMEDASASMEAVSASMEDASTSDGSASMEDATSTDSEDLTPEEEFKEKLECQLKLVQIVNKLYFES